jgi:hypothetical protein
MLLDDIKSIQELQEKTKEVVCLALIRNSLTLGNERIKTALKESKLDKGKTFDKIIILMFENCKNLITKEQIENFLTPENILSFNEEHRNLISFSSKIFSDPNYQITFTAEESNLIKELSQTSYEEEDEEFDEQPNKLKNKNDNTKLIAYGIGAGLILLAILFGVRSFLNKKEGKTDDQTTTDKKKKKKYN